MPSKQPGKGPVGHCNPPTNYQWKKGCPSPNPAGRPCNAKKQRMLQRPEPFDEMILRLGAKAARTLNGEEITLAEAVVRRMFEVGLDAERPNVRALQFVLELQKEVSADSAKQRVEAAKAAWAYKRHWTKRIELAVIAGRKIEDPVPHPDDIVVTTDLQLQIVGPATEEAHAEMKSVIAFLENVARSIRLLGKKPNAAAASTLRKLRRQWGALNKTLPPRLQKHWPGPSLRELKDW